LWWPPIFKNRFSSDIDPCLCCRFVELSSWSLENKLECRLSDNDSVWLLEVFDLGKLLVEPLAFEPRAVNLNLWSIASKFFDCGRRLEAAYGSCASPEGVKGRVKVFTGGCLDGLGSLVVGSESWERGPIENPPWCFKADDEPSTDRLVGFGAYTPVDPTDAALGGFADVLDGEMSGPEICGVMAAESSSASTFLKGTVGPLVPSTASRDLVAAGVIGGECIEEGRLWCGDCLLEEDCVLWRLAWLDTSSFDGTYHCVCQKRVIGSDGRTCRMSRYRQYRCCGAPSLGGIPRPCGGLHNDNALLYQDHDHIRRTIWCV